MAEFMRGLDEAFVEALNEQYDMEDGWWRQFVVDKELFLAIRHNAVHVYYRGCRLIEVVWRRREEKIVGKTHYKYLLRSTAKPKYVKVVDGKPSNYDASAYFANPTDPLCAKELKLSAKRYAGNEKKGVHEILLKNKHILDVEIAISDGKTASRIDFAALRNGKAGQACIVFYEVKHFDNKELRSEGGKIPVVEQIRRYRSLLEQDQHRASIKRSYRRVAENLCALKGVKVPTPVAAAAENGVSIEEDPWLVVFGFDGDQKAGDYWAQHKMRLEKELDGRVLPYGDPAGVKIPKQ